MPRPKSITAHLQRDDWELHRRRLFRLFIVEGLPVAEIAKYMRREHGFHKKPKDYEYRFKKWNLRRNLHGRELKFILNLLSERQQDGRLSEVVVSGKRWPESMVIGRLHRHKGSCVPSERFDIELPDSLARVQTPSPLMSQVSKWPEELPWLQFDEYFRQVASPLLKPQLERQGPKAPSVDNWSQFFPRSKSSLESLIVHLQNPRRMRAILEMIAPEVHEGDHETTAEILHASSLEALAVESARLLIYLETNGMTEKLIEKIGCYFKLSHPKNMMDCLRCTGLLTEAIINSLGRSAKATSQVFLRRLLAYSVVDENSFDVLTWLIPAHFDVNQIIRVHEYRWIDAPEGQEPKCEPCTINGPLRSKSLLEASLIVGNTNAVRHLLAFGADPYVNPGRKRCIPLWHAARIGHHGRAIATMSLLLSKRRISSPNSQDTSLKDALEGAIEVNNIKLIKMILLERKRIGHGLIRLEEFTAAAKAQGCEAIRKLVDYASCDEDGLVMLPQDILFSALAQYSSYHDPDALLDKLNYLLDSRADPTVLKCRNGCSQSFILDCIMGAAVRAQIEEDYVLKMVEAMRNHGCPPNRPRPATGRDYEPSVLQAAIYLNYPQLVGYLLEWGVDVDFCRDNPGPETSARTICDSHDNYPPNHIAGRSPLLTALHCQRTKIAKMLLRRTPKVKLRGEESRLAMAMDDDTEMVQLLLQASHRNFGGWRDLFEQAILWRKPESTRMLWSMATQGREAIDTATALRAALTTGNWELAYQKITDCGYNSQALFEAVVQSHTSRGHLDIVELLLATRQPAPNDDLEICAVASAAIQQDKHLIRALMRSLGQGPWIARFPLKMQSHGKDASCQVFNGETLGPLKHILNYAARFDRFNIDAEVLKTLLECGVPATGMYLDVDDNLTAEEWRKLITMGVDPNKNLERPLECGAPLIRAVARNMLPHVKVLCEAEVVSDKMNHGNVDGIRTSRTAVQKAVESGSLEMLQMLLKYGADVKHPAGYYRGATCLQLAAGAGNIGIVRLMLDKGAQVNAKRSLFGGRTAIEIAAENGRLDVLKLLLLREPHVLQTTAGRHQFIRATKMAERNGHEFIAQMLRQHINWNSYDQQLVDEISLQQLDIHLDEMTQELLDSDDRDDAFWVLVDIAGLDEIYEIDGIERWIGWPDDGESDAWTTPDTEYSSEGEYNLPLDDKSSTDHYTKASEEGTVSADEPRCPSELHSGMNQAGEVAPTCDDVHDNLAGSVNLRGDLTDEQRTEQFCARRLDSETGELTQTSAPQALRYQNSNPVWLEMADNDIDNMMEDLSGGRDRQIRMWQNSAHQPATRNVNRRPDMASGEVLDEGPYTQNMGDDAADDNNAMGIDEADDSSAQTFNWGFWDEESFSFQSVIPGY